MPHQNIVLKNIENGKLLKNPQQTCKNRNKLFSVGL